MSTLKEATILYYQDLVAGDHFFSKRRLITDTDVTSFIKITGLTNPLFTDSTFAEKHALGWRIIPAPLLLSITIGLADDLIAGSVRTVIAMDDVRFLKPTKIMESIYVKTIVDMPDNHFSKKLTNLGCLKHQVYNQNDILVSSFKRTLLFLDRPASI
ncbi:MAG: MaoC family dehydratase N-terminal domain-containing protein [Gammaproteobacteria bacterium]|nr:MaoC family dehydratase N-terminal domain-containing protein [Gammaproteobacteria bacterium]